MIRDLTAALWGVAQWALNNSTLLAWLGGSSLVMFVGTLVFLPLVIVRLPSDYFIRGRRRSRWVARRPRVVQVLVSVLRTFLGTIFVLMGIAMLLLPGQGILTIIVGLMLAEFPGKYRFERWLAGRRSVLRSMNWIRRRAHRLPLRVVSDRGSQSPPTWEPRPTKDRDRTRN